jgi:hypothetical protein
MRLPRECCAVRASAASPLIDERRSPEALSIEQSDSDRMARIRKIADEMRHLQEQKNKVLRIRLHREVSTA